MTVSTTANSVVYRGNGAATQFAVPFKVLDEDHLVVSRRLYATAEVEHIYIGTEYSYSGIGDDSGTLTLDGTALDDDYQLVIQRIVPYSQELDIVNAGGFYPETVEEQLDLIAMGIQQVANITERALVAPVGESGSVLPAAADRANKYLVFDSNGDVVPTDTALTLIAYSSDHADSISLSVEAMLSGLPLTPEQFGAVGDGITNDTAAFLLLSAAINAAGGGAISLKPGATYIVGEQQVQTPAETAVHFYTFLPSYVMKFVGLTGPLVVYGNGATLKAPDGYKYGTFLADGTATDHGSPYTGPEIAACYYAMIHIEDCSGPVRVSDLDLDGNILNAEVGGMWGDTGWQIPGIGVATKNNTGQWRFENVNGWGHGLDGMHVNDVGAADSPRSGSGTTNCRFFENGRQALSIVGGVGHVFVRSAFDRTRRNTGTVVSAPGAGVDIEAEGGKLVKEILFVDCDAVDNVGAGLLDGSSANASNITWRGGRLIGTTYYSYYGAGMKGVRFENVLILGDMNNLIGGINAEQFIGCKFSNDVSLSPTGTIHLPSAMLTYAIAGHLFDRCEIICNHAGGANAGNINGPTLHNCTFRSKLGSLLPFGRFTGTTRFIEEGTGTINRAPGGLAGFADGGHAEDIWRFTTAAGVTTEYPATIDKARNRTGSTAQGDADVTLTISTDRMTQRFTAALTADRAVTLSTTGARTGSRFRIVRTGAGAFNLNVGIGPLKALAANQWCEVEWDGAAWALTAAGAL